MDLILNHRGASARQARQSWELDFEELKASFSFSALTLTFRP
jgi:hypothetical protein